MDFGPNLFWGVLAGVVPVVIGFWCARIMISNDRRQRRLDDESKAAIAYMQTNGRWPDGEREGIPHPSRLDR